VGPGTAGALVDAGITPALVPGEAVATALADAFPQGDGHGAVLFPRAEVVEADLAARLRAKGWRVDEVVAYRTVDGHPTPTALAAARRADAITFTSSSTVRSTMAVLTPDQVPPVVATIGPVTSASARAAGLEVAVEADPHTVAGMVDALVSVLGGGRGRRP
jgi:uroporphyrinogen-III synthase